MTQLDRIETMLTELLRRDTPPEALGRLWTAFPWLTPTEPPREPNARHAWLAHLAAQSRRRAGL